jgi:hypothetical protein
MPEDTKDGQAHARRTLPREPAPSGDRAETGDATPSYFDSDGEFGSPEDEEAYAQAARDGAEGDYAEPDGPDFETIAGELDTLSGRTGDPNAEPERPAPAGEVVLDIGLDIGHDAGAPLPTARAKPAAMPGGPLGPDFGRIRTVIQALERAAKQRRAKARQRLGQDEDENKTGAADAGGPGMSSLLQNSHTHSKYLVRGRQLLKRYKRENDFHLADEDVDPCEFVTWLVGLMPFLSPSSRRQYRLSVAAVIQTIPHARLEEAMNVLAAATRLSDDAKAVYKQTREKGGNTSAVRAKRMEFAHFRKIRESLRKMSRAAAMEWLDDWLVAGINTGLRPGEWPLAHLEIRRGARHGQHRIWLHVVNDKATNGRANGTFRTLDISSYRNETLEAIGRMIARSLEWAMAGETSQRQTDCAQLFNQLCNKLFQRMTIKYSLYSLRHQFIANMKTVINDDAQVATLIGHVSVGTQLEHYSKRRAAWSRFDIIDVPVAIEDQVQQVRKHLTTLKDREELRLLRKAFLERTRRANDGIGYEPPDVEVELA